MTARAQCFAIACIVGLAVGLFRGQTTLSLVSLTALIWLLVEWFRFYWLLRFTLPRWEFQRTVNGESDITRSLWANRSVEVVVQCERARAVRGFLLLLTDTTPYNTELQTAPPPTTEVPKLSQQRGFLKGLFRTFASFVEEKSKLQPNQTEWRIDKPLASLAYQAHVLSAGKVEFPGIQIHVRSVHGLLEARRFFALKQIYRVLPMHVDLGGYHPMIKRTNAIPQHGMHRLQRSGMGSELLELREYVPGDPPKSIAWKVSAKRDQWMTRQYESEVPVRIQLILDGSYSTRLGSYGYRFLDQMNFVAASVARTATSMGDPVGAALIDERGIRRIPASASEKGVQFLLRALSDFSINPLPAPLPLSESLIQAASSVLIERFPGLMDYRFNQMPFFLFPILPASRRTHRRRFMVVNALSEIYHRTATEQVRLMLDDAYFARQLQIFLNEAGAPWTLPLVAASGRRNLNSIHRVENIKQCLLQSIGRSRDNEVFVILADLLDYAGILEPLLPTIKLAIAKHHRVAFVCPSPPLHSLNSDQTLPTSFETKTLIARAEKIRSRILFGQLKRQLRGVGVTVHDSGERESVQRILSELEATRTGRSHNSGALR